MTLIGKRERFPERRGVRVRVGDDEIAVWCVQGRYYAVSNICAHQHLPVIHEGMLDGLTVSCPMHGWTFSLETGRAVQGGGRLKTYGVEVVGDDLYLRDEEGE